MEDLLEGFGIMQNKLAEFIGVRPRRALRGKVAAITPLAVECLAQYFRHRTSGLFS
ncbi:hypothetical protein [Brachybacterium sp.]|uniref:hypothetical protein n=1 Tax=Brachybacterium sp. TaxID=1891286 RepID=UPI0039C88003